MSKTTVAAIVRRERNSSEILLTRRSIPPFKGQWCIPGGHIDQDETVRNAIVREVKEETGLSFDGSFFEYFDEIIPENSIHAVVIVFEGIGTGALAPQIEEVAEIGWFSLDEACSLPLAFTHNEILERYAARRE